jgi:hypothetical protein
LAAGGFQSRLDTAWAGFGSKVECWIAIERQAGREAVERVYRQMLSGQAEPQRGFVLAIAG